jgi:hypothetical protein
MFEFQFVMPKNLAYTSGMGKLSVYAFDQTTQTEASGFTQSFTIGSSEANPPEDMTAPVMQVFIGDTTFVNGGIANPNTQLVVRVSDANGINISGYGIGNSLLATLDAGQSFILNDYYVADADDFTKGTINFPLKNLSPGLHTIVVNAWDTYNNPVEATVDFRVTEREQLAIEVFGNYPNPFSESTTLFFTHNHSGDDLEATLTLYDETGRVLKAYDFALPGSTYQVDLIELTANSDIFINRTAGLYYARLSVRSVSDGSKSEQVTKLIFMN